ncbi:phage tail protein [Oenococcus sicerae]|uniref:phage tail protein n=1 Tax=Oenococcus sicerae TaxID=2203724 RepID=UPI002659FEE2|nr:phage tail protein [Oenococcus sicerae]
MTNSVLLHSKADASVEPLACIVWNTFQVSWSKNSTYQIAFTAYDDKSVTFEALDVESQIEFLGQLYVIKTCNPVFDSGVYTKQITALHIYTTVSQIVQHNQTGTGISYTPAQVLAYYLSGNTEGFTYQVVGTFASQQIDNLGGDSAWDGLSKIVSTWPDAIIYPDNQKIVVYQHDSFVHNLGRRISYLHDTSNVSLTRDSTSLTNKIWISGKQKDDQSYYFPPQYVTIDDSIAEYGVFEAPPLSDDRFTDAASMVAYAKTQLSPEPSISIEITRIDSEQPVPGEIRHLQIPDTGFQTDVEVVGFVWYPFDQSQATSLTLQNSARTILDYQNNQRQLLSELSQARANYSKQIAQANATAQSADENASKAYDARLTGQLVDPNNPISTGDLPAYYMQVPSDNEEMGLSAGSLFLPKTRADLVDGLEDKINQTIPNTVLTSLKWQDSQGTNYTLSVDPTTGQLKLDKEAN